jgi:hypothetical protein
MIKSMSFLGAAAMAAAALLASAPAQAGTSWYVQVAPAPVYQAAPYGYQAAPYGYQAAPYGYSQWGYQTYSQPAWVYSGYGDNRGWGHSQRRHGGRDLDRDGIPDRYDRDLDNDGRPNSRDRDRDGDGVPNRYDRRPDNRYRY